MTDKEIIERLMAYDAPITKEYFYGYCRRAYEIYDYKYQLRWKSGLDFYSLAHEYYIRLLTHHFEPLLSKPTDVKLSSWMINGFHYVVLDALKTYNKEYAHLAETSSDVVLNYVRSTDMDRDMMFQVAEAVATHYRDRKMQEIAHLIFYAGYKQKEVAAEIGMTPAAVNQRYKKMMEEVVTPFVIENYGHGLYYSIPVEERPMESTADFCYLRKATSKTKTMHKRTTPQHITTLNPHEIFVFGSNLQGIHAGGAARAARLYFGAEMGNGVGLQGRSYAIPTMQGGVDTIRPYVDEFIDFALAHPEMTFLVTPIGCGIAGFSPCDIAPLFRNAVAIENIYLPESFWEELE